MNTKLLLLSFFIIQLLCGMLTMKNETENKSVKPIVSTEESMNYASIFLDSEVPGEPIDLGLSVKWASHNVGAKFQEGYGGYYAWGEVEEKDFYDWKTYKHCDGKQKACHDLGEEISGTEYDVAHVKWGGKWRMPTKEEVDELVTSCDYVWTKVNGVQGVRFLAKNGNTIFFPNSGFRDKGYLSHRGVYGCYWTGTRTANNKHGNAYNLVFIERYKGWQENYRSAGRSVRPVLDE
jgi:hypothetical protein